MAEKMFVHIALKATFTSALQTKYANSIVFIKDSQEIFTHGVFYAIPDAYKNRITDLETAQAALKYFSKISDGTNVAAAQTADSTLKIVGTNGANVSVDANGFSVDAPAIATGVTNGTIKVTTKSGAVDVPVKGLGSAAYTATTAYGSAADMTAAKADITQLKTDVVAAKGAADTHAARTDNPHAVTKAQVGLAAVENYSRAQILASAALTGTPTAPTAVNATNTTQIATTAFVQSLVNEKIADFSSALVFRGTIGATGATITALPNTHAVGDLYVVATAASYAGQACEVGDMIICVKSGTIAANGDWTVVQVNIDGSVTAVSTLTADQIIVGAGNKQTKALAAGTAGQVLTIVGGKPVWANLPADVDTTYTFASGTAGTFTVTPLGGSAQTVSIGKPATAGTADKVVNPLTISLNGTAQTAFTGAAAVAFNITAASVGAAAASHTHVGTAVTLTGYAKGVDGSAIAAADNVNTAFGKIENRLDLFEWEEL